MMYVLLFCCCFCCSFLFVLDIKNDILSFPCRLHDIPIVKAWYEERQECGNSTVQLKISIEECRTHTPSSRRPHVDLEAFATTLKTLSRSARELWSVYMAPTVLENVFYYSTHVMQFGEYCRAQDSEFYGLGFETQRKPQTYSFVTDTISIHCLHYEVGIDVWQCKIEVWFCCPSQLTARILHRFVHTPLHFFHH